MGSNEEVKEVDPNDFLIKFQKSEGNLGHFRVNNNFLKSDKSYQLDDFVPVEIDNLHDDQNLMSEHLLA
jgi:hypothetical protein